MRPDHRRPSTVEHPLTKECAVKYRVCCTLVIISCLIGTVQSAAQIQQFSQPIEDNSFLIEEAYNQEAGVIQHISTGLYHSGPQRDFLYTFTQEWPLFGNTNQFSFTIPYSLLDANSVRGFGDILLHYRYQLTGRDDFLTLAPRISLILPTGDQENGFGHGVVGIEVNVPASKRLSEHIVAHVNAGGTFLPNVPSATNAGAAAKNDLVSVMAGGSAVWLFAENANLLLEALFSNAAEIEAAGTLRRSTEMVLNPAIRYAIDIGELQIVPGLGIPVTFSREPARAGVFFYLSFEHPIAK
jgi:hypothetical protein